MLGRLLHLGSGASFGASAQNSTTSSQRDTQSISTLESVQEDIHTRNLLFPDAETLFQNRNDQVFELSTTPSALSANAFDFSDEVDLDVRDVRIIVMQDNLGPTQTSLLYDSHPSPTTPTSSVDRSTTLQDIHKGFAPPRKGSLSATPSRPLVIQGESYQPRQGAFDRRASLHSRNHSQAETEIQKIAREYREELATFSSCIFGSSELMAYKGTSTKVHVVPSDPRPADHGLASIVGDGRSSIGRSSARSSKLSHSFTSQTFSPSQLSQVATVPRAADRKKVLITRLFPVNLPNEDIDGPLSPQGPNMEDTGFPFPTEDNPKKKKPQPRQRRTPMYAVVLIVTLPATVSRVSSVTPIKSNARGESSSYGEHDLFPSSYNSAKYTGWNMTGSGTLDMADSTHSLDLEDRMDHLTQHWDIIMRTLTNLQSVVATTLFGLLKQVDVTSPGPYPTSVPSSYVSRPLSMSEQRRSAEIPRPKPPKTTMKLVSLPVNCLASDEGIAQHIELARSRIVSGVSAARVVTGQGRWGIWRDEATWVSKWAAGSLSAKRNHFLDKLFTGFLATHRDWLQALCPPYYRRRALLNQQKQTEEDVSLPGRTVIVSDNKMAARRLIFLLAAFLPANQQLTTSRAHRPSMSTSFGPAANSPPSFVIPVLREESLRRKINRRSGLRRHSRTSSQTQRVSALPQLAHLSMDRHHERRVSDAGSMRASNLPMTGNDLLSRKSSAATTTTVVPETTLPHFSSIQRTETRRTTRHESMSSLAADDLKRSLTRGDSSGETGNSGAPSGNQGSRWGSIVSGLWSTRRRESTDESNRDQSGSFAPAVKKGFPTSNTLAEMVTEVAANDEEAVEDSGTTPTSPDTQNVRTPRESFSRLRDPTTMSDRTPDPTGAFESPVKTSINVEDGVIDVDVPFPDYITSFESAISSPSSSGYLSTPGLSSGLEAFEQAARVSVDGESPLNAAGWLNSYHPDFALQAIPPQGDLISRIKASLHAEPTPSSAHIPGADDIERWVDVSSVLIADTRSQAITRLTYRRLVRPRISQDKAGSTHSGIPNLHIGPLLTPSILPYETQLQEEWIEETVLQADEVLSSALDRVLGVFPNAKATSHGAKTPLPVSGETFGTTGASEITEMAGPLPDVPRVQCKTVVLSALEETIRDVIDRREEGGNYRSRTASASQQNLLRDTVQNWISELDLVDT